LGHKITSNSTDVYDIEKFKEIRIIASEIASEISDVSSEKIHDLFEMNVGYPTPKIGIRGAVFKDNKILMVKEAADNLWSLPGGWLDLNETPREAIEREIFEESGYIAKVNKLILLGDNRLMGHKSQHQHIIIVFFLCDLLGEGAKPSIETLDVGFFEENNLPPLSLGRVTEEEVRLCFKHNKDKTLPAFLK